MADGYYRIPEQIQQPPPAPLPTEIYVNKDFIWKSDQWLPVNNCLFQSGPTLEMYNNTNQYPPGYDNSYQYVQNYGQSYGYQGYGYQPAPPGEAYPQNSWTQPPPGYATPQQPAPPKEERKSEAVVQEIQQQKATLTKQREDYVRKAMVLRRELEQLKHQKQELASNDNSEKELRSVLKDNDKLQDEINSKLKAILNVIEMLSSIIKDGKKIGDLEAELIQQDRATPSPKTPILETRESSRQRSRSPSKEPEFRSERDSRAERDTRSERDKGEREADKRFCYVYYDTGMHWCRACDKFPETAKEFLQHLHCSQHLEMAKENEVDTTPWHKLPVEALLPSHDDAPKKRIPIKGLQFFISAPSWYCKLCDVWIGDLHCASHHLKSKAHFNNYKNFVEQNPHWETEWLKDRERAMTRNGKHGGSDSEDDRKKKKRKHRASIESVLKEKKKKKRSKKKKRQSSESSSSSSSSSDSSSDEEAEDKGKSIRVAMRNVSQVKSIINEDMSKWTVLEKLLIEDARRKEGERREQSKEPEDELINQWMTITNPVVEKERTMLDSLKDRMRAKQDIEKAKMAEMERRRKDKEREELELLERKRRQVREETERADREKKRKEQEEFNRIVDKDRNHVKFRAARENFRKRRSSSDEEDDRKSKRRSRERDYSPAQRSRRDSERSRKSHSPEQQREDPAIKKKPPGPPSYKKLPFIGRMPLFKKKMEQKAAEKQEIKKEEYEPTRRTRFESGNLTKSFIPKPEVVNFPMLSSIPPISAPPAPTAVEEVAPPPPPPVQGPMPQPPKAPKPPVFIIPKAEPIALPPEEPEPEPEVESNHATQNNDQTPHVDTTYYQHFNHNMIYQPHNYHYQNDLLPHPPLEPPPLPPDDDLAMLGICADDIGAQSF